VGDRRVVSEPTPDGTAHLLGLDLPPHRVAAITRRINRLARALRRAGDQRSMDQIRADVFIDLLHDPATGRPDQSRGVVDIRVDLETLVGLADGAGDLAGYGPVIADIARRVTEESLDAEWRYTVTHADGRLLTNGNHPPATHRRSAAPRAGPLPDLCVPRLPYAGTRL